MSPGKPPDMPLTRSHPAFPVLVLLATVFLASLLVRSGEAQQVGAMFKPEPPTVSLKGGMMVVELKAPTARIEVGELTKEQVQAAKDTSGLPKGWTVKALDGGRIALEGPALGPGRKVRVPLATAGPTKLHFVMSQKGKAYFDRDVSVRRRD